MQGFFLPKETYMAPTPFPGSCLLGEAESPSILVKDWALGWLNAESLAQCVRSDEGDYDVVRVYFVSTNVENAHHSALWEEFSFGDMVQHIMNAKRRAGAPSFRSRWREIHVDRAVTFDRLGFHSYLTVIALFASLRS
jgi:hypothetical protein